MTRTHLSVALALLTALSLSACIPVSLPGRLSTPKPAAPSPAPAVPVADFTAMVNAADALILDYWSASNEVYQSGGERMHVLEPIATERIMHEERAIAEVFAEKELTLFADYRASETQFEQLLVENGALYLVVTTCVDYSNARVVDPAGNERPMNRYSQKAINEVAIEVRDPSYFTDLRIARWEDWESTPC